VKEKGFHLRPRNTWLSSEEGKSKKEKKKKREEILPPPDKKKRKGPRGERGEKEETTDYYKIYIFSLPKEEKVRGGGKRKGKGKGAFSSSFILSSLSFAHPGNQKEKGKKEGRNHYASLVNFAEK